MDDQDAQLLMQHFARLLREDQSIDPGRQVNPVDTFFAYRLLLRRNPQPDTELPHILADRRTHREMISTIVSSGEFANTSGYLPPNKLLMAELDGFRFWFSSNDREMGVVMGLGLYEPNAARLMRRFIQPGARCLDVGGQTGFYTCLMASLAGPTGLVYAFEPMPANYEMLERNVRENRFEDRVRGHRLACSNRTGTIAASAVSGMYVAGEVQGSQTVTMPTVRLDDVVDGPIDVVKIDIEGHEPAAIEGMRGLIAQSHPVIFSECNEYWLRTCSASSGKQYVDLLISLGYEVYNVAQPTTPLAPSSVKLGETETIDIVGIPIGDARRSLLAA